MLKNGKEIKKIGKGNKAQYFIKNLQLPTLYNSSSVFYLSDDLITLPDFSLLIAIAMAIEDKTFNHRTYKDFLSFLEIPITIQNIKLLKKSLIYLDKQGFITYKEDTSNKNYFIAS